MHNLLEGYLEEVTGHLAGLPAARRMEELREMRTHLENAVIVGRELGRTEDEAARDAVAQFGAADAFGHSIVVAWRRGRIKEGKRLAGIAGFTFCLTSLLLLPRLTSVTVFSYFTGPLALHRPFWAIALALGVAFSLAPHALAGGLSGILFLKRAAAGVAIAAVARCMLDAVVVCAVVVYQTTYHSPALVGVFMVTSAILSVLSGIVSVLSARVVGQWHETRLRRRYQAAASEQARVPGSKSAPGT